MSGNTDLLWIFVYTFFAVAAVAAVLATVGLRILIQDFRQSAAVRRASVHPMSSNQRAGAPVRQAA